MTPEKLKAMNGRRVLVEGRLVESEPDKDGDVLVEFAWGGDETCERYVSASAIREILPEPIKAGDRVKTSGGSIVTVLAVYGDEAWVLYSDGSRSVWPLSELTIVEPGQ